MTMCQRCGFHEAKFKVNNKYQNYLICEFCEEQGDILVGPLESNTPKPEPEITYGRLHLIKKSKKPSICRECKKELPVGSSGYNQRKNIPGMSFPLQTRLCEDCANKLIEQGTEVAEK